MLRSPLTLLAGAPRCSGVPSCVQHKRRSFFAASLVLLGVLALLTKPQLPLLPGHLAVPLHNDLAAAACGWRTSGARQGSAPLGAEALAAAVQHTVDADWDVGNGTAPCSWTSCLVLIRSSPLFFSSGAVTFESSRAGDAGDAVRLPTWLHAVFLSRLTLLVFSTCRKGVGACSSLRSRPGHRRGVHFGRGLGAARPCRWLVRVGRRYVRNGSSCRRRAARGGNR